MRKSNAYYATSAIVLAAALFTAAVVTGQTPAGVKRILENELTVKPSPTPNPAATLVPDPWLYPPDPSRKLPPEPLSDPAYYIQLRGVSRVLLSDDQGNTDDLFQFPFNPKVQTATYDYGGDHSIQIVLPARRSYSITFEGESPLMSFEILNGRGNTAPDKAIRYVDLALGHGRARVEITPLGVKPLRLDQKRNGRFDLVVQPTVSLRGRAAKDTHGPLITFHVIERTATSLLISIKAVDKESRVKSVTYCVDGTGFLIGCRSE